MKVNAMYDQVLFRESINPFVKKKTDSGLYIPAGISFTDETGDMEKLDQMIGFGIVVEAGSECKYVKAGDAIFYDRRSIRAVPAGEVLWNMSERGMVGFVKAEDEDLVKAFEASLAEDEQITKDLQANAAKEDAATKARVDALDVSGYKSSPLIKVNY